MKTLNQQANKLLIDAIEEGIIPWEFSWNNNPNVGLPRHPISRKKYVGIDILLLRTSAIRNKFHSKYWATYLDWANQGFVPPEIIGTPTFQGILYNADQIKGEGIEQYQVLSIPIVPNLLDLDYTIGKKIIESSHAKINHFGERAFYTYPNQTKGDIITLPPIEQFADLAEYYYAALHELIHWSELRLAWNSEKFGSEMTELIAEIGSNYLMLEAKLPMRQFTNRKRWLPEWLRCMKQDDDWIIQAAKQAYASSSYVFSLTSQT